MSFLASLFGPGTISALGSIGTSLIGANAAETAANQERSAYLSSAQQVNQTSQNVNQQINQQIASGQTGITGAATTAGGLAQAAGTSANAGIGSAVDSTAGNYSPYTSAGSTAVNGLQQLAGSSALGGTFAAPTAASLNDPNAPGSAGYQFTLQQGQEAIQKAAAAQGGLFSSGTLKSLAGYTTGTANQYYNQAYNQALSTFQANQQSALNKAGVLSGLANNGLQAAAGTSNAQLQGATTQGANTIGTGEYAGTTGLTGATSSGQLGLSGAVQGGQLIQSAASTAAGYGAQAGQALAAGTLGKAASYESAVNGVANNLGTAIAGGGLQSSAGLGLGAYGTSPFGVNTTGNN